jgi:ribonuclease HI
MNGTSEIVSLQRVEIYTDGGCEPNPGPGGYGVLLVHPGHQAKGQMETWPRLLL